MSVDNPTPDAEPVQPVEQPTETPAPVTTPEPVAPVESPTEPTQPAPTPEPVAPVVPEPAPEPEPEPAEPVAEPAVSEPDPLPAPAITSPQPDPQQVAENLDHPSLQRDPGLNLAKSPFIAKQDYEAETTVCPVCQAEFNPGAPVL